jgi:hypothetical protein
LKGIEKTFERILKALERPFKAQASVSPASWLWGLKPALFYSLASWPTGPASLGLQGCSKAFERFFK